MKIRKVSFLFHFILSAILLGCSTSIRPAKITGNHQEISTSESSATILPSQAREPTGTLIPTEYKTPTVVSTSINIVPTWTPLPTVPLDQYQDFMVKLLEDNRGCKLPCLWGITPGETSWEETKQFFDSFATTGWSPDHNAGFAFVSPPYDIDYIDKLGYEFYVSDGVIMSISTVNHHFPQIDAWYSLPGILQNLGEPDQVSIYTDGKNRAGIRHSGLILFYAEYGAIIESTSFSEVNAYGDEIKMCPWGLGNYMNTWAVDLGLTYEDAVELYVDNADHGLPNPRPLHEVTDIDTQIFFETFREPDNKACITTYLKYWPTFNK